MDTLSFLFFLICPVSIPTSSSWHILFMITRPFFSLWSKSFYTPSTCFLDRANSLIWLQWWVPDQTWPHLLARVICSEMWMWLYLDQCSLVTNIAFKTSGRKGSMFYLLLIFNLEHVYMKMPVAIFNPLKGYVQRIEESRLIQWEGKIAYWWHHVRSWIKS